MKSRKIRLSTENRPRQAPKRNFPFGNVHAFRLGIPIKTSPLRLLYSLEYSDHPPEFSPGGGEAACLPGEPFPGGRGREPPEEAPGRVRWGLVDLPRGGGPSKSITNRFITLLYLSYPFMMPLLYV